MNVCVRVFLISQVQYFFSLNSLIYVYAHKNETQKDLGQSGWLTGRAELN